MKPVSVLLFMIAGLLAALLVATTLFGERTGQPLQEATLNIAVMNWISTLVIGGIILRRLP